MRVLDPDGVLSVRARFILVWVERLYFHSLVACAIAECP
jgi:hypothetical protein